MSESPTSQVNGESSGAAPPSWFERHGWKLMLGLIGLVGLSALSCCGGIGFLLWQLNRSRVVNEMSIDRASEDPRVTEAIGEPIKGGWFMQGAIEIENGRGGAGLRIPVQGPNGRAEILSQAVRREGQWRLRYLAVVIAGSKDRIVVMDRRDEPLEGQPPPSIPASPGAESSGER